MTAASTRTRAAEAPVMNPAVVLGASVTLSWSAVAGATSYRLTAGIAPGMPLTSFVVGNTTTVTVAAPAVGTYYVQAFATDVAGESVGSNEIPVVVTSLFTPPAAPVNLAAYANGRAALLTWDLGAGGGAPTSLVLHAGTSPGASDAGVFPLAVGSQLSVPSVNPGTYYLRLYAVNAGGASLASNEVLFDMPVNGACSAPPARAFTPAVFGRYVQLNWVGVPGAAGYRLDVATSPGGPPSLTQGFAPGTTRLTVNQAPLGVFYGKLTTGFSCGSETTGPEVAITIDGAPPAGPRTPNPPAGQRLGLPNMSSLVNQVANERRDLLLQSCREHGGNNRWLFELVRRLRGVDNRWGLNWKRGNRGDMSQDIVTYNFSSDSDEDTTNVYIIDVIGGHCGSNPGPSWIDQTEATRQGGTIGRWTLLPYLDAGYPIVTDPQ
ncbi:MAG: hypothetical protein R2712_04490 [Vicinamibacterales bacterium]